MRAGPLGALLAIGLVLGACAAPGGPAFNGGAVVLGPSGVEESRASIPPELLPSLEALEAAVSAGDEPSARAILRRVLARQPSGPALDLALAFERILDGREAIRSLSMRLEVHDDPAQAGRYALELVLEQDGEQTLGVRPGPARILRRVVALQSDGTERREATERTLAHVERIVVTPGLPARIELGSESIPDTGGALAVRCTWELRFLSGEVRVEDRTLPAMRMEAEATSRVLLASFLPPTPVEPAELARYLREPGRVRREPALERAVRVAPSRYGEALDALAADAQRMNLVTLEEVVPALRWLAGERAPGGDAEAWRRWLLARAAARSAPASTLDMPSVRR